MLLVADVAELKFMNPILNTRTLDRAEAVASSDTFNTAGVVQKSVFLLFLLVASAMVCAHATLGFIPAIAGGIVAFVVVLVVMFKPTLSPYLAPVYAIAEGAIVGVISAAYADAFNGIILQALLFTFGTLAAMLGLYQSRIIVVTAKLRSIIFAATVGIAVSYFVAFIASLFGFNISFLYGNGPLSIGISVVICIVAAMNFLLDFDTIERANANRAPKYFEWVASLGLLITTVWLYLEILRLLGKLNQNK